MTTFQIVFLVICGAQALLALAAFLRSRHIGSLLFASLWAGATVVIAQPELSTRVANAVGIGRGVDLVIYALLAVFVWGHYQHFLRYKRVENHITQIVRELAIREARSPAAAGRLPQDTTRPQ